MKVRHIPYGYQYKDGKIVVEETAKQIVQEIYSAYLSGSSMLEISERLNNNGIEYMPGVTAWNKGRMKRILEDGRYLGTELYPIIIDRQTYDAIQFTRLSRSTQTATDRKADIFQLTAMVRCSKCGEIMNRHLNKKAHVHERWICRNAGCKVVIGKSDEELLSEITALLNTVIQSPETIRQVPLSFTSSAKQRRLENEIGRTLDARDFDKETLQKKMLECVSLKYESIDQAPYTAKRLKADLERSGLLSTFSAELVGRAVKEIYLAPDGAVSLLLVNGQMIGGDAP